MAQQLARPLNRQQFQSSLARIGIGSHSCLSINVPYHEHDCRLTHRSFYSGRRYRPELSGRSQTRIDRRHVASVQVDKEARPLPQGLKEKQQLVERLYQSVAIQPSHETPLPDEKAVLHVLEKYDALTDQLLQQLGGISTRRKGSGNGATSAMLKSLNKGPSDPLTPGAVLDSVSNLASSIVELPTVFLTAPILKAYIDLQSKLGRPQNFPYIFDLYRNKPSPRKSSTAPFYTLTNATPNAPAVAVPTETANTALSAAITAHDLPLALSVIETTFSALPYFRHKVLRQAIVPLCGAAIAPFAAYTLASQFALFQNSMDPAQATTVAMAGITTYMVAVGSMGYIAVTTANDQMVRVTWSGGTPLWERWSREEERAAIDRVAQAWGFREKTRWGDEVGEEWEELREWVGLRGMVLDRVEFMQGMQ